MESERTVGPLVRRRLRSNDLWGKRMGSVWSRLTLRHLCDLPVEIVLKGLSSLGRQGSCWGKRSCTSWLLVTWSRKSTKRREMEETLRDMRDTDGWKE